MRKRKEEMLLNKRESNERGEKRKRERERKSESFQRERFNAAIFLLLPIYSLFLFLGSGIPRGNDYEAERTAGRKGQGDRGAERKGNRKNIEREKRERGERRERREREERKR